MTLKPLPSEDKLFTSLKDHVLFTGAVLKSYVWKGNLTRPGIVTMLSGEGRFAINRTSLSLGCHSFLVLNRGSELSINISIRGSQPAMLFFDSALTEFVSESILLKYPGGKAKDLHDLTLVEHIHYKNATLKSHLEWLIQLGDSCASFHALKADMIVRSILDDLIHENYQAMRIAENIDVVKQSTRIELYRRLSQAKEWLTCNYCSSNLHQVADIAMLNHQHFLRLFRQAFRITPHQYLIEVRLRKAQELLQTTDHSVTVICQQVGFESLASFSTLFKKRFGISPTTYRKRHNTN